MIMVSSYLKKYMCENYNHCRVSLQICHTKKLLRQHSITCRGDRSLPPFVKMNQISLDHPITSTPSLICMERAYLKTAGRLSLFGVCYPATCLMTLCSVGAGAVLGGVGDFMSTRWGEERRVLND